MSKVRRSISFSLMVLLSVIIPLGISGWSVYQFLGSATEPFDFAILKNGEIWFQEYRLMHGWGTASVGTTCHLKRRNLTTGEERPAMKEMSQDDGTLLLIEGDFYLLSDKGIYQLVDKPNGDSMGDEIKFVGPIPDPAFSQPIFMYEKELTTVARDGEGNGRLMHLRDGRWVDGQLLRLPRNCNWHKETANGPDLFKPFNPSSFSTAVGFAMPTVGVSSPSFGVSFSAVTLPTISAPLTIQKTPALAIPAPIGPVEYQSTEIEEATTSADDSGTETIPPTTITMLPTPMFGGFTNNWSLQVLNDGEHLHLLYTDYYGFSAYRDGFDFDNSHEEGLSALAAENMIRDPNGWEPIPKTTNGFFVQKMVCDRDGVLFSTPDNGFVRKSHSGEWSTIHGFSQGNPYAAYRLLIDPAEKTIYITEQSGEVLRVEGNVTRPTSFRLPDLRRDYLARWKWLLSGLFVAWVAHYLIVTLGTSLLVGKAASSTYEFGNQAVGLAPVARRGCALLVDALILVSVFSCSLWGHFRLAGLNSGSLNQSELVELLRMYEQSLFYNGWQGLSMFWSQLLPFDLFLDLFYESDVVSASATLFIVVLLDTGLALWFLRVFDEGRFGLTPGKRLLGIRTVRSTLRPCGIARALVRDVVYGFDLLALVTPLPAAVSILFFSNRQRWGDRVADTIVIKTNSLREVTII